MLLVHKDISHMPITELENDLESIWVKVFANKTSHFVASWYRPPGSTSEEFQLFREQLDYIRTHHKGKKLPSTHVLGDFKGRMERVLLSRTPKRQRNLMVSLRMCSVKMNTPRSRFWIGLHLS